MTGLDIEESTGSSSQDGESTQISQPQSQIPYLSHETNTENADTQKKNPIGKSNSNDSTTSSNLENINSKVPDQMEFINVPFETPTESKTTLQIQLLQHQIEYTRRDIYNVELAILEKERSLLLSDEERLRLLENSKSIFDARNII